MQLSWQKENLIFKLKTESILNKQFLKLFRSHTQKMKKKQFLAFALKGVMPSLIAGKISNNREEK